MTAQSIAPKNGLNALLTPEESVLVLIDHQPFQFANLHSHDPTMIQNNVVGLAKTAKVYGVPTVLTTVLEERGGLLVQQLQDVFPEQQPINRTMLNAWEDQRVVDGGGRQPRRLAPPPSRRRAQLARRRACGDVRALRWPTR